MGAPRNTDHCWKILLILVLGKVASKTQYSHFVICKVWVLGFTHHFTLHPLIWQIFSLISWLYFSTMWILWGRKCDYWVFHITHAKKGLPNHSSSTRDLKDFFSICDVENTILTYPPHSILSVLMQYCGLSQFSWIRHYSPSIVSCSTCAISIQQLWMVQPQIRYAMILNICKWSGQFFNS